MERGATADSTKLTKINRHKLLSAIAKIILPLVLAGVCLYYILTGFEWAKIRQTLQTVDSILFLSVSVLTTLLFWLLKTLRWRILLKNENLNISFLTLYLHTAVTVGFANFTPLQSGEALKVELLRRHGGERVSGYNYFFLEKACDLLTIASLAAFGVWLIFREFISAYLQLIIVGLILILAALILVFAFGARKFFEKIDRRFRFAALPVKHLLCTAFLTTVCWLTMILGWKLIFQSTAINLTIAQTAAVIALTTIVGILSFVPGAVGVSEISIAVLLSHLKYDVVAAQTGAVMIALYTLVILILAIIHLIILKTKNFIENKKRATQKIISV